MDLPLPPMYGEIMVACARGGWAVTEYDGGGFTGTGRHRYTGVVAVRGDLRVQVEWQCAAIGVRPAGPWQHRVSSIAVRHPDHDRADFASPLPRRWYIPATADPHRRCRIHAVYPAVRLLGRDPAVLADIILAEAARQVAAAPRRRRRGQHRRAEDVA